MQVIFKQVNVSSLLCNTFHKKNKSIIYNMDLFTPWFDKILPLDKLKEQCPFVDEFKIEYVKCFHNVYKVQEFDWRRYLNDHPDVKKKGAKDELTTYHMWIQRGRKNALVIGTDKVYEGFSWNDYLKRNSGLGKHGIRSEMEAYQHWINHGRKEKRVVKFEMGLISEQVRDAFINKLMHACVTETVHIKEFDWKRYFEKYPDLVKAGYSGEKRAYEHWALFGRNEGRTAFFIKNKTLVLDIQYAGFPWRNYLAKNPILSHLKNELQSYNHWVDHGRKQNLRVWDATDVMKPEGLQKIFKLEEQNNNFYSIVEKYCANVFNADILFSYYLDKYYKNETTIEVMSNNNNTYYKLFEIKDSSILMCSHSNLNVTAGDTIMMSNYMNLLMKNNNKITLVTPFEWGETFTRNLEHKNYTIVKSNELVSLDIWAVDFLFIRNHHILDKFIGKSYLQKTFFYGLDVHLEEIAKMNNQFLGVITQSEKIKEMYLKKGVLNEKIQIIEPFSYKYDFQLPERKDNEIRLIYCGTLRDEENILEIIEEFQKIHKERPEVVLKIVYGKINGNQEFTQKVNHFIKHGVKGITFKHNLTHRDACYEIATSDIGICWRKNGWGDNGEISTKVKEYEMYGLEIMNNMKIKVGVVTSTNKLNKIDNIIRNFKQQLYFNKKLFLVLNNNDIDVNYIQKQMTEHNILYEIIYLDEKFNLGHCLNEAIKKLKEQNYDIFSKFDDDDIYEKYYILEQTYNLSKYHNCIVGKYNVPLFIPEYNNFYTIDNFTKNNEFAEICRGSTIMFNVNDIKYSFNTEESQGVDTLFLKKHINSGGKIYVTSFNNYIWIRHLDNKKHTWKLCTNDLFLKQITDANLIYKLYSSLLEYKFIDVSHLLVTAIITMYNSSKTIEKCLLSMLDQSHKNIEIIVVDDESTDDSVERVTSFIEVHRNIKLIKNTENRGTYYCKNMALKNMSKHTKYIAFQDSDDFSHKERIRKQIEVLHMTNGKLSVSLCERYNNLRFACVSQVYDIEIFNKLGYFDNSRFGADSEYLYRFFKLNNIKLNGNYNYNKGTIFENNLSIHYCIPYKLYIINNNDDTCLSNINPLNSKKRIEYKNKYMNKINNLNNLYYEFTY